MNENLPLYLRHEAHYAVIALPLIAALYFFSKRKTALAVAGLLLAAVAYKYYLTVIFWVTGKNRNMWSPR